MLRLPINKMSGCVVVFNSDLSAGLDLHKTLNALDIDNFFVSNLNELTTALLKNDIKLFICEDTESAERLCMAKELIESLERHERIKVLLIASQTQRGYLTVQDLRHPDAIVYRPFSIHSLLSRVTALLEPEHQHSFVLGQFKKRLRRTFSEPAC